MKKQFIFAGLLAIGFAKAQKDGRVGINTMDPKGALEISRHDDLPSDQSQGVMFPSFATAEREQWTDTKEGTMIYNTTKRCLEMYFGIENGVHQWNCIPDTGSKEAQKLNIAPAGFTGTYISGVALSGNTVKFKISNNSFFPVNNVDFSTAVSVQNGSSNIAVNGSGNSNVSLAAGAEATLSYTLSGTPAEGSLTAHFSKLGLDASQSIRVGLGSASFTSQDNTTYVVSLVYNNTSVQGKINNSTHKLNIQIPYQNGKGSYNAYTNSQTTAPGEGGDSNGLTLSIPSGNFGVTGNLQAEIKVDGDGEYLVKRMAPGAEYVIATFPVNINGSMTKVVVKGIGGIPDKNFEKQTFGKYEHRFIYLPMMGPDGKMWLNNNLGAEYSRIDSPYFNPIYQAGALDESGNPISNPTSLQVKRDWRAYGSLFEIGRDGDGHELVNWTNSFEGTLVNNNQRYDAEELFNGGYTKENDPCPSGWHTPTKKESKALYDAIRGVYDDYLYNPSLWDEKVMKLPAAGIRRGYMNTPSLLEDTGYYGIYTRIYPEHPRAVGDFNFTQYGSNFDLYAQRQGNYSAGFSIRCIAD